MIRYERAKQGKRHWKYDKQAYFAVTALFIESTKSSRSERECNEEGYLKQTIKKHRGADRLEHPSYKPSN
jgi:hypothetical protein